MIGDLPLHLTLVLVDVDLVDDVRERLQRPRDAALDQVDVGELQRLEEAAGQTRRHAVALPHLVALAGTEADHPWIRTHCALHAAQQRLPRPIAVHVAAGEDDAVAHPVLQNVWPRPTCMV